MLVFNKKLQKKWKLRQAHFSPVGDGGKGCLVAPKLFFWLQCMEKVGWKSTHMVISNSYKVLEQVWVEKVGSMKLLGAFSSQKLSRASSYMFDKSEKTASKCDSNMPKGTLNHFSID